MCPDGVERRFYPRIFSYSADYPEKYVFYIAATANDHLIDSQLPQGTARRHPESRSLSMPSVFDPIGSSALSWHAARPDAEEDFGSR